MRIQNQNGQIDRNNVLKINSKLWRASKTNNTPAHQSSILLEGGGQEKQQNAQFMASGGNVDDAL